MKFYDKIYQDVRRYFPAETGSSNLELLDEMITKKVEDLAARRGPWQLILEAVEGDHGEKAYDISAIPFPGYSLRILLAEEQEEFYVLNRFLCLDLSLITPYYTLFFDDHYKYNSYKYEEYPGGIVNVDFRVLSYQSINNEVLKLVADKVDNYVKQAFSDYKFAAHNLLFNYSIDDVNLLPYKVDDVYKGMQVFNLHNFAMSHYYQHKSFKVIV